MLGSVNKAKCMRCGREMPRKMKHDEAAERRAGERPMPHEQAEEAAERDERPQLCRACEEKIQGLTGRGPGS